MDPTMTINLNNIGNDKYVELKPPMDKLYKESGIDFESDKPLVCPMKQDGDEICEACQ